VDIMIQQILLQMPDGQDIDRNIIKFDFNQIIEKSVNLKFFVSFVRFKFK
jgi:hypothetical protein